ncbi:MAG: SRPBCC family protein [Candidatus Gracilibacteria bacterium]
MKSEMMHTVKKEDLQIVTSRVFNAPRKLMWEVLLDPKHVPNWWGPGYLTTVVDKMDTKVGGEWRFVQSDKDGNVYAFNGVYKEITPMDRVVQTFEFEMMPGHIIVETMNLEDAEGGTRMTNISQFASREDLEGMLASGMEEGDREGSDRLYALLESLQ